MAESVAIIIEDSIEISKEIEKWLKNLNFDCISCTNVENAKKLIDLNLKSIKFCIMDIMIPENDIDETKIKILYAERDEAYDKWLEIDKEGRNDDDPEYRKLRFEIDSLDNRIFQVINMEGGIEVINYLIQTKNGSEDIPIMILTARENMQIRERVFSLLKKGKCRWLIKPIEEEQFRINFNKLLLS